MRDDALVSLIDLDHASSEIYLMAHDCLHRLFTGGELEREHVRLRKLQDRVNENIISVRITLNEGKGG